MKAKAKKGNFSYFKLTVKINFQGYLKPSNKTFRISSNKFLFSFFSTISDDADKRLSSSSSSIFSYEFRILLNFLLKIIKIYGCNFQKFSVRIQNDNHYCKYYKDFLTNFDKL